MTGTTLRNLRTARGLSATGLARAAGLDPSYIIRLEHNTRQPSRATAERIIAALELAPRQADTLRSLWGFAPLDQLHPITDEPAVLQLYDVLHDPLVPPADRDSLRQAVTSLVALTPRRRSSSMTPTNVRRPTPHELVQASARCANCNRAEHPPSTKLIVLGDQILCDACMRSALRDAKRRAAARRPAPTKLSIYQ